MILGHGGLLSSHHVWPLKLAYQDPKRDRGRGHPAIPNLTTTGPT
jgi:hypothetical protein